MHGYAVDGARVDHHGQRACECSGLEGLEIFFAQHLWREVGRCTILTCPGRTVCEIVLRTGANVKLVDVVGIISLITLNLCLYHTGIDNGILAETLPYAGPAGVAAEVDNRVVYPRTVGCPTLIGCNLSTCTSQFGIKGGSDIDGLWEKCTALRISDTVIMVQAVNIGNAKILHRLLLNQADPFLPFLHFGSTGARGIEDGTNLPLGNQCVEHCFVEFPDTLGFSLIDIYRKRPQLVDDLLVCLLQCGIYFLCRPAILLQHGTDLLTIYLGILNGHLSDDVEVQFKHLANLLVEAHFGERFFNLRL